MELIALLLIIPMAWTNADGEPAKPTYSSVSPRWEQVDGKLTIQPPEDQSLSMTVVEHRGDIGIARGPASLETQGRVARVIEVIVSAP